MHVFCERTVFISVYGHLSFPPEHCLYKDDRIGMYCFTKNDNISSLGVRCFSDLIRTVVCYHYQTSASRRQIVHQCMENIIDIA